MTRLETRNILIDTIRKLDNCIENLKKQPAAKRELVAMDKNGNEIECFDTIGEAVDLLGISYQRISKVLSGLQKTAGEYTFKWRML